MALCTKIRAWVNTQALIFVQYYKIYRYIFTNYSAKCIMLMEVNYQKEVIPMWQFVLERVT